MVFERIAHMEWAKLQAGRYRLNLASSGVPAVTAQEFPALAGAPTEEYAHVYGFSENADLIARRYGVDPRQVLLGAGSSMVNFLCMAALIRPGDDVLVEHPTYEPLWAIPRALGARVLRFHRPMEKGFALDPEEIATLLSPTTRLIVLSNLHNPSGTALPPASLIALGALARERGLHVLVDEVYLDFLLRPGDKTVPPAAALLGPRMVSTSSLTKVYGLGALRAGWAIAERALVERAYRVNDYLGVNDPTPSARLAAEALRNLDPLAERSQRISARGRSIFAEWIAGRGDLACVAPAGGIIAFVRITSGVKSSELVAHLATRYQTLVTPGEFFDSPGHLRIGLGLPPEELREALARLGNALDELRGA